MCYAICPRADVAHDRAREREKKGEEKRENVFVRVCACVLGCVCVHACVGPCMCVCVCAYMCACASVLTRAHDQLLPSPYGIRPRSVSGPLEDPGVPSCLES